MKILFISSLYPKEYIERLKNEAFNQIQNSLNTFQWAITRGLVDNNVDFDIISMPALPCYPIRYSKLHTPSGKFNVFDYRTGAMISYCTLLVYKSLSIQKHLFHFLNKWCSAQNPNEELIVLTYTPDVAYINSLKRIKRKFPNVIVASIVTDLVDDLMSFAGNRTLLKRLQSHITTIETKRLYKEIDKFILLSKAMEEKIPEAIGRNIVTEGIALIDSTSLLIKKEESAIKTLLYSGSFEEFAGVKDLIEAFLDTTNPCFRLQLCGNGTLSNYIINMAENDCRIDYRGMVSREESIKLQSEATLVINPRKPNGGITKFSFPSKTMEYLSSGTAMIGYHLEGIPLEYYPYFYTPEDLSINALTRLIEKKLTSSQKELNKMAKAAKEFIISNKTPKTQVGKIIDFLQRR